jgi:N-carbamoylputrescine amidase
VTTIALEQLRSEVGNASANLERIVGLARGAFTQGAGIAVFPELALSGYTTDETVLRSVAAPVDGPAIAQVADVAGEYDGLVVLGFAERDGAEIFNSVVIVGGSGPILHYRKLHLFDAEQRVFSAGDLGLPIVDTDFGRLAACVCYDLRFVEVLRLLSLRGADLVFAPAAWVGGFDAVVPAQGLTRQAEAVVAQANLDQVAVVAVSQVGSLDGGGGELLGGSLAVDAYGAIVGEPLSRTDEGSALRTLDIVGGRDARVRAPLIRPRADRRSDIYACTYEGTAW